MSKVICPSLFSEAEQDTRVGTRKQKASGPESKSQRELGIKPELITEILNERHQELEKVKHQNSSQEATSKALKRKGAMKMQTTQNTRKDVENLKKNQ